MNTLLELKYHWSADSAEKNLIIINGSLPDSIKELLKIEVSETIRQNPSLKEFKHITNITSQYLPKNIEFYCYRLFSSEHRSISLYMRAIVDKPELIETNNTNWIDYMTSNLSSKLIKDINKNGNLYQSNSFNFIFSKFKDDLKKDEQSTGLFLLSNYLKFQYNYIKNNQLHQDQEALSYYNMSADLLANTFINKIEKPSTLENKQEENTSRFDKLITFFSKKICH